MRNNFSRIAGVRKNTELFDFKQAKAGLSESVTISIKLLEYGKDSMIWLKAKMFAEMFEKFQAWNTLRTWLFWRFKRQSHKMVKHT